MIQSYGVSDRVLICCRNDAKRPYWQGEKIQSYNEDKFEIIEYAGLIHVLKLAEWANAGDISLLTRFSVESLEVCMDDERTNEKQVICWRSVHVLGVLNRKVPSKYIWRATMAGKPVVCFWEYFVFSSTCDTGHKEIPFILILFCRVLWPNLDPVVGSDKHSDAGWRVASKDCLISQLRGRYAYLTSCFFLILA